MKITKKQLKRIIREESRKLVMEQRDRYEEFGNFDRYSGQKTTEEQTQDMHVDPQPGDHEKLMGSAEGLAQDMQVAWMDSNSNLAPGDWVSDQDGVWVEAVVAEYMDKLSMPAGMGTTDPPMDTMREEATQLFLNMR